MLENHHLKNSNQDFFAKEFSLSNIAKCNVWILQDNFKLQIQDLKKLTVTRPREMSGLLLYLFN